MHWCATPCQEGAFKAWSVPIQEGLVLMAKKFIVFYTWSDASQAGMSMTVTKILRNIIWHEFGITLHISKFLLHRMEDMRVTILVKRSKIMFFYYYYVFSEY